jgi:hypothetical protein
MRKAGTTEDLKQVACQPRTYTNRSVIASNGMT